MPSNTSLTDDWAAARLIPTAGIRGQDEQETRATSALLAVIAAVPDFGHRLLTSAKAPKGQISSFTEVRLKDEAGKVHIPDGAIVVQRGKTRWSALVEVKTGRSALEADQVSRYLDLARRNEFDAVLTLSNQIVSEGKALPFEVDKRKVGRLTVRHLSWWQVLTEAIVQHRFKGVEDADQAWILNELIRYLNDERSGASGFEGMGEEWTRVREGSRNGTLRASDPEAKAIAARWIQFLEYLCLNLSQELGVQVARHKPRGQRPGEEPTVGAKKLAGDGILSGSFKVPDAIGPIAVEADVRGGLVTTSVEVMAPKDAKTPRGRVGWMLRQLKSASDDLRIDVRFANLRETRSELLGDSREAPERLLLADDPKREPRSFLLARTMKMGRKAGRGDGSFVAETRKQAMSFYRELVQELRPPRPKAPKLPDREEEKTTSVTRANDSDEAAARREGQSTLKSLAAVEQTLGEQ